MKVAVIGSPEDGDTILGILETFEKAGLESYGLKLYDSWTSLSREQIEAHLLKATHFLLLATGRNVSTLWFAFARGYSLGRESGIAIYRDHPRRELPRYLAGLPVIDTLPELVAFYEAEKSEWRSQEIRRISRATLLELGISYHADSLAQCVADGDSQAVELFLKSGFNPGSRDRHGVTLLCLAARNKHRAVAELLLERGADLDMQSEDRGFSPVMDASLVGSADLVELFLSKGADPDLVSKDGQTALVVAVGRNDAETVRILLSYGADPDIGDKLGFSARRYASLFKKPEIVSLFDSVPRRGGLEGPR